jgi:hypothetical protein
MVGKQSQSLVILSAALSSFASLRISRWAARPFACHAERSLVILSEAKDLALFRYPDGKVKKH